MSEINRPTHGFNVSPQDQARQAIYASTAKMSSTKSHNQSGGSKQNQSLKIVETGQEHTGRWTREEHNAFLLALQQYGKEWKKVAAKVKTRTVVQTRTHAQKYFQKLQKGLSNEKGDVEMGTVTEAKKILPIASARRSGQSPFVKKGGRKKQDRSLLATAMSTQVRQAAAATQAAAQLMTQMSKVNTMNEEQSMLSPPPGHNPQMGGVYSAQSVQAGFVHPGSAGGVYPIGTNFGTPMSNNNMHFHNQNQVHSQMKIIAPQPDITMKKNMFPEPSPAACGKRKAIELAAAQMLAGVAASGGSAKSRSGDMSKRTTPPPDAKNGELNAVKLRDDFTAAVASASSVMTNSTGAGSLQIINPENLQHNEFRQKNLGHEPVTPWDGQLEALSSEVKTKVESSGSENSKTTAVENMHEKITITKGREKSTLHVAVCNGLYEDVDSIIMRYKTLGRSGIEQLQNDLRAADQFGFNPLHAAVTLQDGVRMTRLLISEGAFVNVVDAFGNTPLHWAARVGNVEVLKTLFFENCPLDTKNDAGETALHWAMRAGRIGILCAQYLLKNGARSSLFNRTFERPLDVAAKGFEDCEENCPTELYNYDDELNNMSDAERVQLKADCRSNLFNFSPQARTLVLHHPECLEHLPKFDTDWEAPDRVNAIMKTLLETDNNYVRENEVQVSTEFDRASLEFLSRVHSAEYLTFVNNLSKELEKRHLEEQNNTKKGIPSVVPFTPMVQRTIMREPTVKKGSHSDTSFSSGSLRAARRAAGAVKHAVDCVLVGRNRNAFCITRPPGHHAGINGLLDGGESCGFCIFNNVAAGALHALSDENLRPKIERCAIVDIDIHHGNGTEEIVKKCDHPGRLFFFSAHLYDNDKKRGKQNVFKFYPGTGDEDDVAHNVINVPIAPMWRSAQAKSRSQSPVPPGQHNTRHKSKQKTAAPDVSTNDEGVTEQSPGGSSPDEREPEKSSKSSHNTKGPTQPSFLYGTGREAYRQSIIQRLLPALRAFNPDLILLSMGLDACRGDVGNARHYKNGRQVQGIDLTPEDYAWTTSKIMEVADICCQGRVVSVLEGGYGRPRSDDSDLLDKSMISECAMKHLQALIDPNAATFSKPWI